MIFLLFILILGITAMALSLIPATNYKYLKQTGIKTEGVVYDQKTSPDVIKFSLLVALIKTKAIVRFTTEDLTWIDVEVEQNIPAFLNDSLKVGKRVELYYDAKNPHKIFLDTAKVEREGRILFLIIGLIVAIGSAYLINNY